MSSRKQKAICVLGMHRSGTSAIARIMNLLGAYIGSPEKLLPPKKDNPEGFWEHISIINFHERLLEKFSSSWDSIFPFPEKWWKQPEIEPYRRELIDLIKKEFADHPLWMWKDPRTSLFLPLWIEVLNELDIDVYYLISLRNPLDVANSLLRRDGFLKNKSLALWQLYNLSSFYWTNNYKRFVVHYDKLLEDWEQCFKSMLITFDIPWPQNNKLLKTTIESFLKPDLRNSHSSLKSLVNNKEVPEPVISAYRLFIEAEKDQQLLNSKEYTKNVSNLYHDYYSYLSMINQLTMKEETQSQAMQVYWALNSIFTEEKSTYTNLVVDGEMHVYDLEVPLETNISLRIDPVNFPAYVEIKSIELCAKEISSSILNPVISWPRVQDSLLSDFNIIKLNNKKIFSFFSVNDDPQLFLENLPSLENVINDKIAVLRVVMSVQKQISNNIAGVFQAELFEKEAYLGLISSQINELQDSLSEKERDLTLKEEQNSSMKAKISALQLELNKKDEQIRKILSSWSWRVTMPLRLILKALRFLVFRIISLAEVLLRTSYKPTLKPINDLKQVFNGEYDAWESTSNDPQFYISKPYPKGWTKVKIRISCEENMLSKARLYVNRGSGFSEDDSFDLGEVGDREVLQKSFVPLGLEIVELRLDPLEVPASFRIKEFTLERVSFFEVKLYRAISYFRRLVHFIRYSLSLASSWRQKRGRLPHPGEFPLLIRKAWYMWRSCNRNFDETLKPPSGFQMPQFMEPYDAWLEVNQWNSRREQLLRKQLTETKELPVISVIMPVYNPPLDFLARAIESVREQVFDKWELCIADDASTDRNVRAVLKNWSELDERISVSYRDINGNISNATNSAVSIARGDFLVFLDQDDELSPDALGEVALYIAQHPETDVLYSDDDKITADGLRFAPQFKPDWSPELLLSYMYFSHLFAIRHTLFKELGGMRVGFEGSQDYDLALRATERARHVGHIPKILYHWRVLPGSTALSGAAKPASIEAGRRAVEEALIRRGIEAAVIQPQWAKEAKCGIYNHIFPDIGPKVTILIPTRNNVKILKSCLDSLSKTTYQNFEIVIIDNESDDPATINYLSNLQHRVIYVPNPGSRFNFAAINNIAVERIESEYILFLNNDTEVRSPIWLSQLVGYLGLPGVGAVGAKLVFPDGRMQHAGIVHGYYHGMAGPAFKLMPSWDNGYLSYAAVARNYLAVTAACLLTRRDLFRRLNGFNETAFAVAYNDVDYCYRLHGEGYRVVYCPSAELIHHEGYTRGFADNPAESVEFRKRYSNLVDPYYSPNLSLDNERFDIAAKTIVNKSISSPIRTLMCAFNLNWEGAPYSQYEMTARLKEQGIIDPVVYCPNEGPLRSAYEEKDIPVYVFGHPLSEVNNLKDYNKAVYKFAEHIKSWNVDLVYGNTLQTFYAIDAARCAGLPSVWNPRESEPWQSYFNHFGPEIAVRALKCFNYPYQVVFVADATRSGCTPLAIHHNFTTVHNGLDRQRLEKAAGSWPRNKARSTLSIAENEIMLLLLGTVCERKGQIDLVEAMNYIPKQILSKLHCFIIGDRAGTYSDKLAATWKNLPDDCNSRIKIIPETPDTALYYSAADIFICTSRIESFPRVILEAMAYGLPIITTPVFGITEQVQENVNAYFYNPGDIRALADAIVSFADNESLRKKMAENSKYVLEILNGYDEMTSAYGRIFLEAWLSGGPRSCVASSE